MFGHATTGHDDGVTDGLALAGGWLIFAGLLFALAFVLLRRRR
jgi:hypothetical protein